MLAAHALANGAIVDARGVLAALSSPRPRRTLIADAPCAPVDVVGATLLCRTPTDVALWREGTLRWRSPAIGNHHAMLLDGGAAVLVIYRAAYQRLDAESGAPFAPPEPVLSNLFRAAGDGRSAVGRAAGTLLRVRGRETTRVAVGGGSDIGAAAIDASGERWAALLKSGELVLGRFGESSVRRLATAVGAPRLEGSVLAFVPGGDELVAGTTLGGLVRIATRDGSHVPFWSSRGNVRELLVSPDGKRLVASWDALSPLVIGLDDGVSLGRLPWRGRAAMRWAGATELITADHEIVRWDFAAVVARAVQVSTGIVAVSVSSDGTRLAIANGAEVAVVDSRTHARLGEARWQDQFVKDVAFVPGSHDLVAHGFGDARLAHIDARLALDHRFGAHSIWRRIAVLAGGAVLAARYKSGVELYRDRHDEPELVTPITMYDLVTSPDGHLVAALGDGQVFVGQDLETGGRLTPCASDVAALAVAVLPDGGVVVASPDAVTERCGPVTRRYDVPSDADLISVVASIRWVAAGDRDGTVWLWRTGVARPHAVFRDHQGRVPALALDPMGKWLAAGDWSGRLSFFDLSEDAGDQRGIAEAAWGLTLDLAFGRRGTSDVSHP